MQGTPINHSVLTADLCAVYGCEKCPGIARVGDLPPARIRDRGWLPDDPAALAVCTHECHRLPERKLESTGPGVTVTCPRCGEVQTLLAFLEIELWVCRACGEAVPVAGTVQ